MVDFGQLIAALSMSAADLMYVIQAFCYAAGIFFVGMGVTYMVNPFKQSAGGAHRNIQSKAWLWSIAFGVTLFALPETMSVFGGIFVDGADTSPLAYSKNMDPQALKQACAPGQLRIYPLLIIFGYVAFIRGILVWREAGVLNEIRGNPVWRGLILIVSGILLVHMKEVLAGIGSYTGLKLGAGLC